jgi:hypothetical protein
MAITLEIRRFFCTANLDEPYVATLMEDGQLLEQMAYYPNADAAIAAGLAWVREHRADDDATVAISVMPDP